MKSILVKTEAPNGETVTLKFGRKSGKLKRNSECFCGSGTKFKRCCVAELGRPAPRLPSSFLIRF